MTANLTHGGTIWVCVDCLVADVNGEEPIDRPATEPETWALWENDTDHELTMGMLHEDHECDRDDDGRPLDDECGCQQRSFSWTPCDGCGSTLGGAREAYTYWTRDSTATARHAIDLEIAHNAQAACPDHAGYWFHKSSGDCSCGARHTAW